MKFLSAVSAAAAIALRLLHQSERVIAPETFCLESCVVHSLRVGRFSTISQHGEISMKTGRMRLNLESFAEQFLRFLVATQSHDDSADVIPRSGHEAGLTTALPGKFALLRPTDLAAESEAP